MAHYQQRSGGESAYELLPPNSAPPNRENATAISRDDRSNKINRMRSPRPPLPSSKSSQTWKSVRRAPTTWWTVEVSAGLLSIACTIAIAAVLAWMNGRALREWNSFFQPNTVVSILATVAKSSLLLVVSQCISQLKWIFYRRPHKLATMEAFDQASRGPLGAVQLLWTAKAAALAASLGALVTIASLGVDPFVQEILAFRERQIKLTDNNPQIPLSRTFDSGEVSTSSIGGFTYWPISQALTVTLQGSILSGLYNSSIAEPFSCNSPSCTWDDFSTLGICSSCKNVTGNLQRNCSTVSHGSSGTITCNFTTPGNFNLSADYTSGSRQFNQTLFNVASSHILGGYQPDDPHLVSFATAKFSKWSEPPMPDPESLECSLRWCGKTYVGAQVVNGSFSVQKMKEWEFVNSTEANYRQYMGEQELQVMLPDPNEDAAATGGGNWTINGLDWYNTANYLEGMFTTSRDSATSALLYLSPSIPQTMQDIATSMTNTIRLSQNGTTLAGSSFSSETYIHVRWPYFILPAAVVLAANVLLLLTILSSSHHGHPLWKSSTMALLYHGLASGPEPLATTSEMKDYAAQQRVKLAGTTMEDLKLTEVER